MCDACRNRAAQFVQSLTDEQRQGFDAYEMMRVEDHNQHHFNLGRDDALAQDNTIYEEITEQHAAISVELQLIEVNDRTPEPVKNHVKKVREMVDALPGHLR